MFFERLYEINRFDDQITSPNTIRVGFLPVNFFIGIIPTVFLLVILGLANDTLISLLAMFFVGPLIGSVFRKILFRSYSLVVHIFVTLIPKNEEEAYQRRMERVEKKKKKRKRDNTVLAAYGDDQYQVIDEEHELTAKKK
jgi:pilus assembly protein TadC